MLLLSYAEICLWQMGGAVSKAHRQGIVRVLVDLTESKPHTLLPSFTLLHISTTSERLDDDDYDVVPSPVWPDVANLINILRS